MNDLKDKAKEKIDATAEAGKKAAGKVADKSKGLAHAKAALRLEESSPIERSRLPSRFR